MSNVLVQSIDPNKLDLQTISYGQVFITSSNIYRKSYYDLSTNLRNEITNSCKFYSNYDAIKNVYNSIIINKLYVDSATLKIYGMINGEFIEITNTNDLETIINNTDDYKVGILYKDGKLATVVSTANQILTNTGLTYSETVDETKLLTVIRVKFIYVTIKVDNTKSIYLPYPKENYDFANGDSLYVVKDNMEYSNTRYFINGNYLVLNETQTAFNKDELLTLIFYYKTNYDMNSLVELGTQNYADASITSEKLSPYLEFSAERIDETNDRLFFTPEEKTKLEGIEDKATHYIQPETWSADMIVETDNRMFISKAILERLITTDNGYTKKDIDDLITNLVGDAPDLLNTLKELANALNNDADFASNITKLINEKATQASVDKLSAALNKKVDYTDYIRGGVFGVGNKSTITGIGELYTITLDDSTFENYVDFMKVVIKIKDGETNTTTPYLRINSLANKSMLSPDGEPLFEGDLVDGGIYEFRYNGTKDSFILQGKGGVVILDTSLNKYQIAAEETISKGNLLDILEDNTVCLKRPCIKMCSISESEQTKFYSNGKIEMIKIDEGSVLVVWLWDKSLRTKVVNISDIYVKIDDMNYTEISTLCTNFTVSSVGSNYIISYSNSDNTLNISHLSIGSESEISIVKNSSYIKASSTPISELYSLNINNKLIVIWQSGTDTECVYFDLSSNVLTPLSSRTNTNYFIDKICKVNNEQIVFAKISDKIISTWVMNISESDFSFSDLSESFYISNTDNLSNLVIFRLSDTEIYMSWTNSQSSKYYYTNITVTENSGLTIGNIINKEITSDNFQSYNITKQVEIESGYFLSVSNYNYNIPTTISSPGRECVKLLLCKNGNPFDQIDIFSNIYNKASYYDFIMLNDKKIFVVYNDKQTSGDIYHLYFMICDIIHNPFGVATESGVGGYTIRVREW